LGTQNLLKIISFSIGKGGWM